MSAWASVLCDVKGLCDVTPFARSPVFLVRACPEFVCRYLWRKH